MKKAEEDEGGGRRKQAKEEEGITDEEKKKTNYKNSPPFDLIPSHLLRLGMSFSSPIFLMLFGIRVGIISLGIVGRRSGGETSTASSLSRLVADERERQFRLPKVN